MAFFKWDVINAGGGDLALDIAGDSSANMAVSNGLITTTADNVNNTLKSVVIGDYEQGWRDKLYVEAEVVNGAGSVISFGFVWSLIFGTEDMNPSTEGGVFLNSIGVIPRVTENISAAPGAGVSLSLPAAGGDVWGLAADYENLLVYAHRNGVWSTATGEPGVGSGVAIRNTSPNLGRESIIFGAQISRIANTLQIRDSGAVEYQPSGFRLITLNDS